MRLVIGLWVLFVCGGCFGSCGAAAVAHLPDDECEESAECGSGEYCRRYLVGSRCEPLREQGEDCTSQSACATGLVCNKGHVPARCEPRASAGSPCARHWDCIDGLRCNAGYDPARCEPRGDAGSPCKETEDCRSGLTCIDLYDPARCEPPGEAGSACVTTEHCDGDLLCNRPDIEQAGTCIERGSLQAGEACTFFVAGVCGEGLVCGTEQRCVPPAGEGDPCAFALDNLSGCAEHLVCWEEVCRPLGVAGDPCPCEEGLLCHGGWDPPRCEPPSEEGAACGSDGDCADALICDGRSLCRVGAVGDACDDAIDCQRDLVCVMDLCATQVQQPGQRCKADRDCAEGTTCLNEICRILDP